MFEDLFSLGIAVWKRSVRMESLWEGNLAKASLYQSRVALKASSAGVGVKPSMLLALLMSRLPVKTVG